MSNVHILTEKSHWQGNRSILTWEYPLTKIQFHFTKERVYWQKTVPKLIIQKTTPSFPKREAIDQNVFASKPKKATDFLSSLEQKLPNHLNTNTLIRKKLHFHLSKCPLTRRMVDFHLSKLFLMRNQDLSILAKQWIDWQESYPILIILLL